MPQPFLEGVTRSGAAGLPRTRICAVSAGAQEDADFKEDLGDETPRGRSSPV